MNQEHFQALKARSAAERKPRLARAIDNGAMLIAAIRLYLAFLLPERRADAAQVFGRCKDLSPQWRPYLKAGRRILGAMVKDGGRIMTMPQNWRQRLARIGLEISPGFLSADQFFRLNANLELDTELTTYAGWHPQILDGARAVLCGGEWPPKPEPIKLDPISEHVQAHVQENLRERFEREL